MKYIGAVQAKVDEDDQYNSMKKRIKFMLRGW